jgi:DNA-binding LacI/PurR family transcriptional regulator
LGRWLGARHLPVLFLGGNGGDTGVTTMSVLSLSGCVRQILPDLLARGHRNFSIPLCGYPEAYAEAMGRVCREELESRGLAFVPRYHVPCGASRSGEAVRSALELVFSVRAPTALMFPHLRDYLAVLGMLEQRGLVAGKNLFVAVLGYEEVMDWMDPKPAHFVISYPRLWKHVKHWLHTPPVIYGPGTTIDLDPIYVPESCQQTLMAAGAPGKAKADSVVSRTPGLPTVVAGPRQGGK